MLRKLTCSLFLGALLGIAQAQESGSIAHGLPSDTLLHLEVPSWNALKDGFAKTEILALINDEEFRTFLDPAWKDVRADIEALIEDEERLEGVLELVPGRVSFSLISVEMPKDNEDPQVEFLLTAELGDHAATFFDRIVAAVEEEGVSGSEESEIAGRRVLQREDDGEFSALAHDGSRLVLAHGEGLLNRFFEPASGSLADHEAYRQVLQGLEPTSASVHLYADLRALYSMFGRIQVEMGLVEESNLEAFDRIVNENPSLAMMEGFGFVMTPDGSQLRDRFYLYAPGDRSAWGESGPIGDVPSRHAALVSADAEFLMTWWMDFEDYFERVKAEQERVEKIYEELELEVDDSASPFDMQGVMDTIREKTEIDLVSELFPALGNQVSLGIDLPENAGFTSIPDVVLVLEVVDGAAVDAVLEKLLAADEQIPDIRFRSESSEIQEQEFTLYTASLVNAAVPVLPTICRAEGYLLFTLDPGGMTAALKRMKSGEGLAADKRFINDMAKVSSEASLAGWADLGASFQFLFQLAGVALSAMRMQGMEISERFDPALLPDPEIIGLYLNTGVMVMTEDEAGITLEGRSAVGNPVVGLVGSLGSLFGFIAASEGLKEEVQDLRRRQSEENLEQLAAAMKAYKNSVGSGSYPTNLVHLIDRGILEDVEVLIDPSDPKPRKVRSGSGDRVPISYGIVDAGSLPDGARERIGEVDGAVIYTRGAWYENWSGKGRLILPLEGERGRVVFVGEEAWQ